MINGNCPAYAKICAVTIPLFDTTCFVSEFLAYKEPAVGRHPMYKTFCNCSTSSQLQILIFRHQMHKTCCRQSPHAFRNQILPDTRCAYSDFTEKKGPSHSGTDLHLSFETTLFQVRNRYKHVYRYLSLLLFLSKVLTKQ